MEQTVRDHGAVPATIALLHGAAHVGLDAEQLEEVTAAAAAAAKERTGTAKISRRDLAFALGTVPAPIRLPLLPLRP